MAQYYPYLAYPLPYPYVSLLPCFDADTIYAHHKYYANGVERLNRLTVRYGLVERSLEELILEDLNLPPIPEGEIKDLAGLVYNHRFYFDSMTCEAGEPPENAVTEELKNTYGSMEKFEQILLESAKSVYGSGWTWLILENGGLHLATTKNNETVGLNSVSPILVADLWEHAYFPIHRFNQETYLREWFSRINWERIERRYLDAVQ